MNETERNHPTNEKHVDPTTHTHERQGVDSSKRFYLASAFDLVRDVQRVCDALEARGHTVPVKWWNLEGEAHKAKTAPITEGEFYASDAVKATAARDFSGVATCDALVIITDGATRKFNGASIELGFALAKGKPCYALGMLDRSAMFADVRHGLTLEAIVAEVEAQTRVPHYPRVAWLPAIGSVSSFTKICYCTAYTGTGTWRCATCGGWRQ